MSSLTAVPRPAWKALFAAQAGWMLDAADFLLFIFALRAIQVEFSLPARTAGSPGRGRHDLVHDRRFDG